MSKPLSEDSLRFLIIAIDDEAVHLYQLRANGNDKNRVKAKFELLAEHHRWEAFKSIQVIRLVDDEELESLATLGPEVFPQIES